MRSQTLTTEEQRNAAVKDLEILDTLPEGMYDDITFIASQICGTPISLISFILEERQWFKSKQGLELSESPRDISFCTHAIEDSSALMEVPDALEDERFLNNPYVLGDPNIRFYAGAPLTNDEGQALGTLCVLDREPKILSEDQKSSLSALARQVEQLLKMRKQMSAREKLRKELENRQSLYKLVSENASDLVALHKLDGTYHYLSPSCKELLGYEQNELLGKSPADFVHPADMAVLDGQDLGDALLNMDVDQVEYRIRRKDGLYIWMESYFKPIANENGVVDSFQSSSRDVTERRKERNLLKTAKQKAEEASEAKNRFLSMMSHEIRTPLNGIIGATHLLLNKNSDHNRESHLDILKQSSNNLLSIVNDILDFNKIEEGKLIIDDSEFDLYELIDVICRNYEQVASEKGISFKLEFEEKTGGIYQGDSVRISQVLHNLISNAIKFTSKGGVTIVVKSKESENKSQTVIFEVHDTGLGIPKEKQSEIFEEFVQAESSTTRKYGGSGLGLAITRRLINLMGSEVLLDSESGRGSKFYFSLNLKKIKSTQKLSRKTPIRKFDKLDARIMLVEDNIFNMAIAREFLKSWGCEVIEAVNGQEALVAAESRDIDLILLDIQMPVMDGFETIYSIRKKEEDYFKSIPVIALTAGALGDIQDRVFEAGMNDILTKPFLPLEFYNKLVKWLNKDNSTQQPAVTAPQEKADIQQSESDDSPKDLRSYTAKEVLDTLGDEEEVMNEFLDIFEQTMSQEANVLEEAIAANNMVAIGRYAHKVKASTKALGLTHISEELEDLEKLLQDIDAEDELIIERSNTHLMNVRKMVEFLVEYPTE